MGEMEVKENKIDYSDRKWLFWFAFISLCITSIPYFLGMADQGSNWVFTGFVFGVEDGNSYIAKMLAGANGSWLFTTPYTAFPQHSFLVYFPLLLLGKLASGSAIHTQLIVLYQIFRWVAGFLLVFSLSDFISIFISNKTLRRWGVFTILFGGGLGWLVLLNNGLWQGGLPLEFYSPESFGFLSFFGLPHLAIARALFLWGMGRIIRGMEQPHSLKHSLVTGLYFCLMGFFQPLSLVTGWVVMGIFVLTRFISDIRKNKKILTWIKQTASVIGPALGISLIWIFYNFTAFQESGTQSSWYQQNILSSPPIIEYVFAFLLMLPLSFIGVVYIVKHKIDNGNFLIGWLALFPILAYMPVTVQRRLPEGIWIALVILALFGVGYFSEKIRTKVFALPALVGMCSTLVILVGSIGATIGHQFPLFRQREEIRMFEYLANEAQPEAVILASFDTSNALPAWLPLHTITGHGPESINFSTINQQVNDFYATETSDESRLELINDFGITYVLWGPYEQELGGWNPSSADYLTLIYQDGEYNIFQVAQ
jgi:hypothetical protein